MRILLDHAAFLALAVRQAPPCRSHPDFPGILVSDNPWLREWSGWLPLPGRIVCADEHDAGGLCWVLPAGAADPADPAAFLEGLRVFHGKDTVVPMLAAREGWLVGGVARGGGAAGSGCGRIRIGCVGAGGHGNPLLLAAVRHGFRSFTIVDDDHLESGNLNRFHGAAVPDCGRYKTALLAAALASCDPQVEVRTVEERFPSAPAERALADCDVLFSCVDNDAARRSLQLFALALHLPLFDLAAGIEPSRDDGSPFPEAGGQVRVFLPGGPCLACMGLRADGADPAGRGRAGCLPQGEGTPSGEVALNGIVALLGLTRLVEWVCGAGLDALHLKYSARPAALHHVRETRRADCPLCGDGLAGG